MTAKVAFLLVRQFCQNKEAEIKNASLQAGGLSRPLPHSLPSSFSPPFEFAQHGARNRIRFIEFSAFSQDRQLRRLSHVPKVHFALVSHLVGPGRLTSTLLAGRGGFFGGSFGVARSFLANVGIFLSGRTFA